MPIELTPNEIKNLLAGREMDILIAKHVMGICVHHWEFGEVGITDCSVMRVCRICNKEYEEHGSS